MVVTTITTNKRHSLMFTYLALAAGLFGGSLLLPIKDTFQPTINRTFVLTGTVDLNAAYIAGGVMQLALMPVQGQPIDIMISSEGGFIYRGAQLIAAIEFAKSKGIDVRCVNMHYAYSDAFMIYMHCSHRFSLPQATFMFHYPRIDIQHGTADLLESTAGSLRQQQVQFVQDLQDNLHLPEDQIIVHCENETMWSVKDINDKVPGFTEQVYGISGVMMQTL